MLSKAHDVFILIYSANSIYSLFKLEHVFHSFRLLRRRCGRLLFMCFFFFFYPTQKSTSPYFFAKLTTPIENYFFRRLFSHCAYMHPRVFAAKNTLDVFSSHFTGHYFFRLLLTFQREEKVRGDKILTFV